MEKVQINVNQGIDGTPIVVHLLEGKSPNPVNPKSFSFTGNIYAVEDYIKGKKLYNQELNILPVIVFDTEANEIIYTSNQNSEVQDKITASLEISKYIKEFGINTDKRFSPDDLKKLIKLNPHVFKSPDSHKAFLTQLGNFKAKIEREIEQTKDTRGGSNNSNKTNVLNLDIAEDFIMNCAVFKGGKKVQFTVSVCYEVAGTGIVFYMESPELVSLFDTTINEEFERQRNSFTEQGFVCVVK